jgi:hypothetical protein
VENSALRSEAVSIPNVAALFGTLRKRPVTAWLAPKLKDLRVEFTDVAAPAGRLHLATSNRAIVYEDRLEDRAANAGAVIGRAVRENWFM